MAEVVIVDEPDAAGELAARASSRLVRGEAGRRARARDRIDAAAVYRALRSRIARPGRRVAACAASRSTSTSACPPGTRRATASVITREVVEPLGLDPVARPRARTASLDGDRARRRRLRDARSPQAGGVDLQMLGIGTDGHIGFNEPGSSFASLTRVKTLTEQTRARQRAVLRLARTTCRGTASRRGSARSCAPATWCCSRSARARPRRSPAPSRVRCRRRYPGRRSSCTRT